MAKAEDGTIVKDELRSDGQLNTAATHTAIARRHKLKPRQSWSSWLVNNIARIAVWYTIITVLFRCPSKPQSLADDSPAICRPYLNLKSATEPFVGPYYDTYASPYVEKARPYLNTANTRIIKPATVLAISNYNKYAAPQVSRARDYTMDEWERRGLPQFKKAQDAAQQIYDQNLAPHVQKVSEAATPYYDVAKENALNIHEHHVLPAIAFSQPHVQSFGAAAQKFMMEKAMPSIQYAWTNLVIFVDGTAWPFVKKVYAVNVRPQLVMIGERIAKYQEGRKLHSAMEEVDKSIATSLVTDTSVFEEQSTTTTSTSSTEIVTSATSSTAAPTHQPQIATDQTINEDLVKWQKKFLVAADKGTDDLKERIGDIVKSLTSSELSEGQGLATALEKTAEVDIASVKAKINSVASTLPENADATAYASAEAELVQAVRDAGSRCKEKAKSMRLWSNKFEKELHHRAELATESTVQVLDDIRDLGLQEIGMRWAWMEGVTYKHWQKYHELKKQFADWRSEVTAAGLEHPALADAQEKAKTLLEESMAVTEDTAKELSRLKDVAKWKLSKRDSSNDFDTRAIPAVAPALSAAHAVADNIKEAFVGSSQGTPESISSVASNSAESISNIASSFFAGSTPKTEDVASSVASAASGFSESASSAVLGSTNSAESVASGASRSASSASKVASSKRSLALSQASNMARDASSSASSAVIGTTGSAESLASSLSKQASGQYSSATSGVSAVVSSATVGPFGGILPSASSLSDSISSSAPSAISSASASQKLKAAVDDAGDRIAEFTSGIIDGA